MGFQASVLRMSTSTVPWRRSEGAVILTTHMLIAYYMIYVGRTAASLKSGGSRASAACARHGQGWVEPAARDNQTKVCYTKVLMNEARQVTPTAPLSPLS